MWKTSQATIDLAQGPHRAPSELNPPWAGNVGQPQGKLRFRIMYLLAQRVDAHELEGAGAEGPCPEETEEVGMAVPTLVLQHENRHREHLTVGERSKAV